MKHKEIVRVLKKKLKECDKLAGAVGSGFDREVIHDFRVSVKVLRAVLRLMESATDGARFKIPAKLKRLYRIAGVIREAQLEMEWLNKKRLTVPAYTTALADMISEQQGEWHKCYDKKTIRHAADKMVTYPFKPLTAEALHYFCDTRTGAIASVNLSTTDTQLHDVRKGIKHMLHVADYLAPKLKRTARFPDTGAIIQLRVLDKAIGNYNDDRLALEHITEYLTQNLSREERTAITQFRDKEQLQLAKQELVGTIQKAGSEIVGV